MNTVSAVKSEPAVFSVKTEGGSEVSLAPVPTSQAASAPTLLSWPSGAYTPTFQVQVTQRDKYTENQDNWGKYFKPFQKSQMSKILRHTLLSKIYPFISFERISGLKCKCKRFHTVLYCTFYI